MEECMGVKDDMCSMTISCGRETAESFVRLCSELGITVSECLTAFMREAVRTNGANLHWMRTASRSLRQQSSGGRFWT